MAWRPLLPSVSRDLRVRFGGYLLTGGSAAVVDLGVFAALHAVHLPVTAAATGSFLVAAAANYSLTSLLVFRHALTWRRWLSFLALATVGLCVNVGVTSGLVAAFAIPAVLAKVGGIGVAFIANFLMNYFVVFKAVVNPSE